MRRTRKDGAPSESLRSHGMTLEEIAKELGMTRQSVQQIEAKAMRKLRRAMGSSYRGPIGPFLRDVVGVPEPRSIGFAAFDGKREARRRSRDGFYR